MLFRAPRAKSAIAWLAARTESGSLTLLWWRLFSQLMGSVKLLAAPSMFYSSLGLFLVGPFISSPYDDWPRDKILRMCQESEGRGNLIYRAFPRSDADLPVQQRPVVGQEVYRKRYFCCWNSDPEYRGPGGSWSRAVPSFLHFQRPESPGWSICNTSRCQTHHTITQCNVWIKCENE